MRTIYKYEIPIKDRFTLNIHRSPVFLDVQVQNGKPCVWFEVDLDKPLTKYGFAVVGTGHPLPDSDEGCLLYQGTFQKDWFVGHLYFLGTV